MVWGGGVNPGRRSQTHFALGYFLSGLDSLAPARSALRAFGSAEFLSPLPKRLKSALKSVFTRVYPWLKFLSVFARLA